MSSGLWDKGFLRPLCSTPQGLRSPGAPPRAAELGSVALAPRLRAWGRSHLLALELASAEGTLTRSAPSSPGSILHFGHTAAPCPQQLSQRQPTLPAAQPPPGSLPSCPARCLLSLCPLLCRWEQFYRREQGTGQGCCAPGRWYSFIVQVLTGL